MSFASAFSGSGGNFNFGGGSSPYVEGFYPPLLKPQTPEQEESLIRNFIHTGLSGMAMAGNFLDIPSSMLRDAISMGATGTWVNPFDQLLSPFSARNRTTGRELLEQFGTRKNVESGIRGWFSDPGEALRDIAGFGVEVLLDIPGYGLAKKGLQLAAPTAKAIGATAAATRPGVAVSDAVRPLVDEAIAGFSKSVLGARGAAGRALGRATTEATELGAIEFRKLAVPIFEEWGKFSQSLKTTGQRVEAHNAIYDALEAGLELPEHMIHLRTSVDAMRDIMDRLPGWELEKGLQSALLDSTHKTKYAPRGYIDMEGKGIGRNRGPRVISGRHQHQIEREPFLKDLEGFNGPDNTSLINELSTNGRFSGVASNRAPAELNPAFWENQRQILKDYMKSHGINENYKHYNDLAHWLADLNPQRVTDNIPVFAKDPVLLFGRRIELGRQAGYMADTMRTTMVKHLKDYDHAGPGYERVSEVFRKGGFDVHQSMKLLREEAKLPPLIGEKVTQKLAKKGLKVGDTVASTEGFGTVTHLKEGDVSVRFVDPATGKSSLGHFSPDELFLSERGPVIKKADDLYIPKELAENISRVKEVFFNTDKEVSKWVGLAQGFTRVWKAGVTSWLAFHTRNRMSGMGMNFVDGVLTPRSEAGMARLLNGMEMKNIPWSKLGKEYKGLSDRVASRKFAQEMFIYDVAPRHQGYALEDLPEFLQRDLTKDIPGVDPISMAQAAKEAAIPLKSMFTGRSPAAEWTEGMNRGAAYLERRLQGMSPREAAARTRASHVDYQDLTEFERSFIRPLLPFYGFTKGMVKKVFSELTENPGLAFKDGKFVGRMSVAIRAQGKGQEEGKPLPDYISQTGAIPWDVTKAGDQRFITSLGLMHEDTLSFVGESPLDTGVEILSRLNPIPKFILELVTGESFFQRGPIGGRELRELDPGVGRLMTNLGLQAPGPKGRARPFMQDLLGLSGARFLEKVAGDSPLSRLLSTGRILTDPRRRIEGTILPGFSALLPVTTGFRITNLSPAARNKAIQQQVAKQALDELEGRSIQETYIPPAEIEREMLFNPERARQMMTSNMIMNILRKRFQKGKRKELRDLLISNLNSQAVQTMS